MDVPLRLFNRLIEGFPCSWAGPRLSPKANGAIGASRSPSAQEDLQSGIQRGGTPSAGGLNLPENGEFSGPLKRDRLEAGMESVPAVQGQDKGHAFEIDFG